MGVVEDYPSKVEAVFEKDVFVKMVKPVERTGEPAVKGTLSWISDRLEDSGGRGSAQENFLDLTKPERKTPEQKPAFTAEDKEEMVQALISAAGKNEDGWYRSLNLMQDMGRQWKTPARRFTEVILKHGTGGPDELTLLREAKHEGLTAWVEEHLHRTLKGESQKGQHDLSMMATDGSESADAYLSYLAEKAPQRAQVATEALWNSGQRKFAVAVVKNLTRLDSKLAQDFAQKALTKATEKSDPDLLEALMEALPELNLPNPDAFLKVIDDFKYPNR